MSLMSIAMEPQISQKTLQNGLKVNVEANRVAPIVAVNLWYNVGSRHEKPTQKGLAHLFEHLMFEGSRHVKGGEHARTLESLGAQFNATTSFDRTNYFETLPVHALELALWLEVDRMSTLDEALSQSEFDAQRDVVKNERLQTMIDVPYGDRLARMTEMLFPAGHHYAITPIGEMDHLDAASLDDLRSFFRTHYSPGNAVLSIVGDVDINETFDLVERLFGHIPAAPVPDSALASALPPLGERKIDEVHADVPHTVVAPGWRMPSLDAPEFEALQLAVAVLGQGDSSRLRKDLVREHGLATSVGAFLLGLASGNSVAMMEIHLRGDADPKEVCSRVDEQLDALASRAPSTVEFEVALSRRERELLQEASNVGSRADALSRGQTLFGDPDYVDQTLDRLRSVTPEDVSAAAAAWLSPEASATVLYLPEEKKEFTR